VGHLLPATLRMHILGGKSFVQSYRLGIWLQSQWGLPPEPESTLLSISSCLYLTFPVLSPACIKASEGPSPPKWLITSLLVSQLDSACGILLVSVPQSPHTLGQTWGSHLRLLPIPLSQICLSLHLH
jgi:hypothetical protein